MERVVVVRAVIVVVFVVFGLVAWWPASTLSTSEYLAVHFLDVGQGDAVYIRTPEGIDLLIDGGTSSAVLRELSALHPWYDREIDLLVATHPDTDHIGGLIDVLQRYEVKNIAHVLAAADAPAVAAFSAAVAAENAATFTPSAGDIIRLGSSTTIQVFSPTGDTSAWKSNSASAIIKVQYGDTGFMLSGDAPASIENYLAGAYGAGLEAEVLKLGHHGSKTSTSEEWLDAVTPQYAVVSAGIDNRYGHPHQSVMQKVFSRNITSFHTGIDGTVSFVSDGKTVWVE